MIENVLTRKNASTKTKIAAKTVVSAITVALAVILPQIAHLVVGGAAGVKWLPMYLPVLIGACLVGPWWGVAIGVTSPLASYLITYAAGAAPMPAAGRLPFMMAELAVFAAVSGAFSSRIAKDARMAVPAVLVAEVCGRAAFMLLVVIFQKVSPLAPQMVWSQIQTGVYGLVANAVLVPLVVWGLKALLYKGAEND